MALIIRGDDSSIAPVRPDQVYKTGVLQPMEGFQPPGSAQSVMATFTNAGLQGATLGAFGPLTRLGLRIKSFLAAKRAQRFMAVNGLGSAQAVRAAGVAPQIVGQLEMLSHIPNATAGAVGFQVAKGNIFNRRY